MSTLNVFLCFCLSIQLASCSKILALMNIPSHSHHLWNLVYLKALAAKGHDITYLGYDDYPNPAKGIRHFQIEDGYALLEIVDFTEVSTHGAYQTLGDLLEWENFISVSDVKQKGFHKFLEMAKNETFDLVVYDLASPFYIIGAVDIVGRPPIIGITAFSTPSWALDNSGTPHPVVDSPHFLLPFGRHMTYFERLQNFIFSIFVKLKMEGYISYQNSIMKSAFGPNIRHLKEIQGDITINLVNSHWSSDSAYPTAPGLIQIAGLHLIKEKPLPKELQDYMDDAKDGVILFSLGSNVQSSYLDDKLIQTLIEAFKKLAPVKVLWKWEKDTLTGKPDNVRIEKWLPQNDILAHPNVRLFFTHGGMLSTQEAIHHGVPVVGLPIFLDQHVNIKKAVAYGFGEALSFKSLTTDTILETLQKVLNSPSYKIKASEISSLFRDKLVPPLDEAVYWTEYAIRHKGAPHLRPASLELNWVQSNLVDIYAAIVLGLLLVFLIFKTLFKLVASVFSSNGEKNKRE